MLTKKYEKEIIFNYLAHILKQEIRNIESPIMNQSKILFELLSWYCYTNIERSIESDVEGSNIWIMNDSILTIQSKGNEAIVEFRNIVSHNFMSVKLKEPAFKAQQTSNEALSILSSIRNNREVSYVPNKEPVLMSPEYLFNNIPFVVDGKT
jgi:hypothetical protein